MGISLFYYHPRMLDYCFGPHHPLKPERLRRTIALLERETGTVPLDPGLARREELLRVHDEGYVRVVEDLSSGVHLPDGLARAAGFAHSDNPPFSGMYEASLAYCGGTLAAARDVAAGARLAFSIAGGLHHAQRDRASGFCIFNDPALAISVLRERFARVAYVDIDLHHGDGVQALFYDDPTVLTASIHQDGRTLYPGTGFVEETGAHFTSINVPLMPYTTGDAWLWAFENGILPALSAFEPEAIVLQMGTDPHPFDPLGHLRVSVQHWLGAVERVRDLGVPIVALGGGGYNLSTVPRMWVAAILTLAGLPIPERLPEDLGAEWDAPTYLDADPPTGSGWEDAQFVVRRLEAFVLPHVPRPSSLRPSRTEP